MKEEKQEEEEQEEEEGGVRNENVNLKRCNATVHVFAV